MIDTKHQPKTAEVAVTQNIEMIGPSEATALLATNETNRVIRRPLVDGYHADMAHDRWRFTGEPIKVSNQGKLLDGQHRLTAVVRSGKTLPFLVVRGLDPDSQLVMDTGAKRTPADALRLRGTVNGTRLAATARMILSEGGKLRVRPTTSEILEVIEKDQHLQWVMESGLAEMHQLFRLATPAVIGYTYWRLHQIDPYATRQFFMKLRDLTNLSEGSPILALHRRLSAHDRRGDGHGHRKEAVTMIFIAWNAWRKGETRAIIKMAVNAQGEVAIPDPI